MMFTVRRGAPTRRMISIAASGSVGETIAPSANETAHGRSISSWAITATPTMVASTMAVAASVIERASARSACRSAKKAAE
jgi:hypothetical protein